MRTDHCQRFVIIAACAAMMAGCALKTPPDTRSLTETELLHATPPAAWKATGGTGPVQDSWLVDFQDPRLILLAAEALSYNADLRAAAARVEIASGAVTAAGGSLYPSLDLIGRSSGKGTGASGQLSGLILSASWELDLWGRIRYGQRAAEDEFASTEADDRFARQSIVATLAKAWFLSAEAMQQQRLTNDMVASSERLVSLAQDRLRIGVDSELEVAQARANLQTYRDSARQNEYAIAQSKRALEMMLGRYPAAEIELPSTLPAMPAPIGTGVPSALLERRPDVIAAERRVAAAFSRVGEAKAARLPRISLTAALSSISSSVFVLQQSEDATLGFGASLMAPLLNGGQLKAQVEMRTAEQKLAAAAFAKTAQLAFNEVETAIGAEASLAAREPILFQALKDTMRAAELEQTRFKIGSRDMRSVTQQQLAAFAANMALLRVQTEKRVQRVQLHLALGGGFEPIVTTAAR